MATSAAAVGNSIIRDLERYLSYIHEDVCGHALASIRGAALSGRLRRLVEGAVQRTKQRQMQIGLLAPIRTLLREISSFTTVLKNSNLIRLLVSRDRVAQQLRAFQLRTSNLASRLQVYVRPFLSADDIRTTSQDKVFFNQVLNRYRLNPEAIASLVRTIRPEELRQLHAILATGIYSRGSAIVAAGEVDFAQKARRAIEHYFALPASPRLRSPLSTGLLPSIPELHNNLGSPSPRPLFSPLRPGHFASPAPVMTPTTQPALQPIRSPLLSGLTQSVPHSLAQSVPIRPLGSPSSSNVSSLDLGAALSPDPILYEDTHISTSFEGPAASALAASSPLAGPSVPRARRVSFATPPAGTTPLHNPLPSPTSIPLPASPLSQASAPAPLRPIAIRYYDANLGKFLEWLPFQGWLWETPSIVDAATDYHNQTVQAQSIVTVVAQFTGLDPTQRQAILDHISLPSRAPSLLRLAAEGDKLRVLRMFNIREVIWLACIPLAGGKPGFIPLKATIVHGNPPLTLPRLLPAPIHGSVRSFNATYRFKDSRGEWRVVRCTGVVQPFRISYHERRPPSAPELPQPPINWLHFPYQRIISVTHVPASRQVDLVVLDRNASREVQLHFDSAMEVVYFVEDVAHMRNITRKILELQERKKREAELRQSAGGRARAMSSAGGPGPSAHGSSPSFGATSSPSLAPMSPGLQAVSGIGISPFLSPQAGGLNDGSLSPHLSQLGSPHLGPLF